MTPATDTLPTFSIVIPTFNRPRQLARCMAAMAALDYPRDRFDVIVVDDASPTPPGCIVDGAKGLVAARMVKLTKNGGPSAARNAGVASSNAEFIAFTDDDCMPDPVWLRAMAAALQGHPKRLCGGRTLNALPDNSFAATSQLVQDTAYAHFNVDPCNATMFASSNMACAKSTFVAVGGFDERFRSAEDRELSDRWRRCGTGTLAYVVEAVVRHAHDLTFEGFFRQHMSYGRGAWNYHAARKTLDPTSHSRGPLGLNFKPDLSFYARCLRAALSDPNPHNAIAKAGLIGVWQVANTCGFFLERYRPRTWSVS